MGLRKAFCHVSHVTRQELCPHPRICISHSHEPRAPERGCVLVPRVALGPPQHLRALPTSQHPLIMTHYFLHSVTGRQQSAQLLHWRGADSVLSSPQSWTCSSTFCLQKLSETSWGWGRGKEQPEPSSSPWDGSLGTCIMVSLMGNCRIRTSGSKCHRGTSASGAKHCLALQHALRHSETPTAHGRERAWGMEHWLSLLNVHFIGYEASWVKFHSHGILSLVFQWLDSQKYHKDLI